MTGGVPYGRPLPGWAEDRDGLKLDQLQLRLGPAYPGLPPGLVLDLHMQGDILQDVGIGPNPFLAGPGDPPAVMADATAFTRAFRQPVPVAALEVLRARPHPPPAAAMPRPP